MWRNAVADGTGEGHSNDVVALLVNVIECHTSYSKNHCCHTAMKHPRPINQWWQIAHNSNASSTKYLESWIHSWSLRRWLHAWSAWDPLLLCNDFDQLYTAVIRVDINSNFSWISAYSLGWRTSNKRWLLHFFLPMWLIIFILLPLSSFKNETSPPYLSVIRSLWQHWLQPTK